MRVAAERDVLIRPATLQICGARRCGTRVIFPLATGRGLSFAKVRQDFEAVVESGQNQVGVWELLDIAGLFTQLVPVWEEVRNLLAALLIIHRHTVDRHQIEALSLLPGVHSLGMSMNELRPRRRTALLLATLFHDIGKRPGWTTPSVARR